VDAYFLWIGSELPAYAKLALASARSHGFRVTCFVDRRHGAGLGGVAFENYRDVFSEWMPAEIVHGGRSPAYEAFADVFRLKLLAERDGWWFDCDTAILRPAEDFARLVEDASFAAARSASSGMISNGAMYRAGSPVPGLLLERARRALPVVEGWTTVGSSLLTAFWKENPQSFRLLDAADFYPMHYDEVAQMFMRSYTDSLAARAAGSHAFQLWGSQLRRFGLSMIPPPPGSFYERLMMANGIGPDDWYAEESVLQLIRRFREYRRSERELGLQEKPLAQRIRRAFRQGSGVSEVARSLFRRHG
jgi:hypothetical protein